MATTKKSNNENKPKKELKEKKIATTKEVENKDKKTTSVTKKIDEKKVEEKPPIKKGKTIEIVKNEKKENKPKKVSKKKESEIAELEKTTVFASAELQAKEEKEIKKALKKQRRSEILKEIRAFLILVISIGLIAFGVWYWYTHFYNPEPKRDQAYEKEEKKVAEYKTIKYSLVNKEDYLDLISEKYLIERDKEYIYKVMDLKGDVLFEGRESFDYIYEGLDNELYAYKVSGMSYENIIELYKLEDKEFNKINTISESNVTWKPIIYKDETSDEKLLGFSGLLNTYDSEMNRVTETKIISLDTKEHTLKDTYLEGENTSNENILTYDSDYIIMYKVNNNKKNYGLYSIKEGKEIISPQYERLYTSGINYIAIKNNKSGIISSKLKRIVDFQYDFIEDHKDYYVVSKNNKLAIMDEDYKLVTDFIFDYQTTNDLTSYKYNVKDDEINTFKSIKKNNKYILTINNGEELGHKYSKHETYIINKNGTYETISDNVFNASECTSLVYSYNTDKKEYTIYDSNIKPLYKINLSEYDYNSYPEIKLLNENTLVININSNIYYNYETGVEIEKPLDYQTSINGITIDYNNNDKTVSYQVNNEIVATIPVDIEEDNTYFNKINDNIIYFKTKKDYVYIEKGE